MTGRTAPRTATTRRLRMAFGYHWRNSANPSLIRLHRQWDTLKRANVPMVVSTAADLSIGYSGLREGLAYTLEFTEEQRLLAGTNSSSHADLSCQVAERSQGTGASQCDIEIVGTTAAKARRLSRRASLVIPMRVHFVVDTHRPAEEIHARISKRERWQHSRNQRSQQWTWELERRPAWFDCFYDRMYRPTMRERHGERERVEDKEVAFECIFRSGLLFFLSEGTERIAGTLCHWHAATGTLTLRLLGVMDGLEKHYRSGAFKAIYHHLLAWAAANGVRRVDFQGTEPFLSKGTFQWKRRLGSSVVLPPNHFGEKRLWLKVWNDTPQVRDFLVANPVLAESADGMLEAVYFRDSSRQARFDLSDKAPGISQRRVVDLDEFFSHALGGK